MLIVSEVMQMLSNNELTDSEILNCFERWTGFHHRYIRTEMNCKQLDELIIPIGRLIISEANRKSKNPSKWKGVEIKS